MNHELAWAIIQAAAVTVVACKGSIFESIRSIGQRADKDPTWWNVLSSCPLCAGVWLGAARAALEPGAWGLMRGLETLGVGCVTGFVALFAWRACEAVGAYADAHEQPCHGCHDHDHPAPPPAPPAAP